MVGGKAAFALGVIGTAAPISLRSMRPGREDETNWALVLLPFLVAMALALVPLFSAPPQAWRAMLLGATEVVHGALPVLHTVLCSDPVGSRDLGAS
jgi:hypothetical protein